MKALIGISTVFGSAISESLGQTTTGKELLSRYNGYLLNNPVSTTLVNNFIREAKNCIYDKDVELALSKISEYLNENKVSWQLSSVCESIENDNSKYNFLNKNAVKQVRALLEMSEDDVIKYVKAGALKNVMYVEGLRNVCKSVYNDRPIREEFEKFVITHPFSLLEENESGKFFAVGNKIYKICESNRIERANETEVSNGFKMITNFINSNRLQFENETLIYKTNNYTITINESDTIVKETNDGKKMQYTVEQFRDNCSKLLSTYNQSLKNQYLYECEMLARIAENFDNMCVMDNVNIISSNRGSVVLIEANQDATYGIVESINANPINSFDMEGNIFECINTIKSRYNIDLSGKYQDSISQVIENEEHASEMKFQIALENQDIEDRRRIVTEMIEKYKNDPTKLAVLSKVALQLNELEM